MTLPNLLWHICRTSTAHQWLKIIVWHNFILHIAVFMLVWLLRRTEWTLSWDCYEVCSDWISLPQSASIISPLKKMPASSICRLWPFGEHLRSDLLRLFASAVLSLTSDHAQFLTDWPCLISWVRLCVFIMHICMHACLCPLSSSSDYTEVGTGWWRHKSWKQDLGMSSHSPFIHSVDDGTKGESRDLEPSERMMEVPIPFSVNMKHIIFS